MRMTTPKEVRMRGDDQEQQGAMWSYVPMERRIAADHPLRRMRPMVDGLVQELSPRVAELYSRAGRLVEAWDSLKSFKRKDAPAPPPDDPGNPTVNFHGERRSNATHASTTDPGARLFRKRDAHEAKLYYTGHVLMENRHGLAVEGCVTPASGHAE